MPSIFSIDKFRVRAAALAVLHTELLLAGGGWRSTVQKASAVVRGIKDVYLRSVAAYQRRCEACGCKTASLLVCYATLACCGNIGGSLGRP